MAVYNAREKCASGQLSVGSRQLAVSRGQLLAASWARTGHRALGLVSLHFSLLTSHFALRAELRTFIWAVGQDSDPVPTLLRFDRLNIDKIGILSHENGPDSYHLRLSNRGFHTWLCSRQVQLAL